MPAKMIGRKTGDDSGDCTIDYNFFTSSGALQQSRDLCRTDPHSVEGEAMYVSPATGNYNPGPGSLAASIGFVPVPMDDFGVRSPRLAALTEKPSLIVQPTTREVAAKPAPLLGGTVRSMDGIADRSSLELSVDVGLIIVTSPQNSLLGNTLGLKPYELISAVNEKPIATIADFNREVSAAKGAAVTLTILHGQHSRQVKYEPGQQH